MTQSRTALLAVLLSAAACKDQPPTEPVASPITLVAPGTVQVIIQQDRQVSGEAAVFVVRVVGSGVPLAAYQGRITFAPGTMEVLSVVTPDAVDGDYRIVNATDASKGLIRFAGYSTGTLASTEAFRISARLRDGVSTLKLEGALDVAAEGAGQSMHASFLRSSVGVYDAASNALISP